MITFFSLPRRRGGVGLSLETYGMFECMDSQRMSTGLSTLQSTEHLTKALRNTEPHNPLQNIVHHCSSVAPID